MVDLIFYIIENKNIPLKIFIISFLIILILITAWLDYSIENFNFFIFFAIYVIASSLFLGPKAGILIVLLCSTSNLFINMKYLVNKGDLFYYMNFMTDIIFFLLILIVVFQLRRSLMRERNLSRTDFLTGSNNKRYFSELLSIEIYRSQRSGKTFCLAYIDMDNFKQVNDTMGHSTGDLVLISFVKLLQDNVRHVDNIGRMGGDEFVILLPETGIEAGRKILERISTLFGEEMKKDDYPVSLSIGLAAFKHIPDSVDEVYKKSDLLMYLAKNGGKDRIEAREY